MSKLKNPFLPGQNRYRGAYLLPSGTVLNGSDRTDWLAYLVADSDTRYIVLKGDEREEVDAATLAAAVEAAGKGPEYAMWNDDGTGAEPSEATRQEALEWRVFFTPEQS